MLKDIKTKTIGKAKGKGKAAPKTGGKKAAPKGKGKGKKGGDDSDIGSLEDFIDDSEDEKPAKKKNGKRCLINYSNY